MKRKWVICLLFLLFVPFLAIAGGGQEAEQEGPREVTVVVRAKGNPVEHWKVDAFDEAVIVLN
ncbi:MAG: hypothetical protein KAU17_16715, partial [Spirochaetales bacterium]|nr:hypothetical protein [Spirochaetales bacterium]